MKPLSVVAVLWLLWGIFAEPQAVSAGVADALQLCGSVLLPSLFPFLVIALFACRSGAGAILSLLLSPVTRYILHLPRDCGELVFFSLIGGYPTGARLLSDAVAEGRMAARDAAVLLSFCVAPGPAFVLLAVGKGMFFSAAAGRILLVSVLSASLLLGALICRRSTYQRRCDCTCSRILGRCLRHCRNAYDSKGGNHRCFGYIG